MRTQAPDPGSNTLLHVVSTLELHVSATALLSSASDEANYTCRSSDNDVGPPVESTTEFRIHYPPRNISVSHRSVRLIQGDQVACPKPPVDIDLKLRFSIRS